MHWDLHDLQILKADNACWGRHYMFECSDHFMITTYHHASLPSIVHLDTRESQGKSIQHDLEPVGCASQARVACGVEASVQVYMRVLGTLNVHSIMLHVVCFQ
jgi:hypothetical protein